MANNYKIQIEPSAIAVDAVEGESVLEACLRAGHPLPYSCRSGLCGTCMGELLAGDIDYPDGRPPALSAEEQAEGKALFCQAHPKTDLVIRARVIDAAGDIQPRVFPCRVDSLHRLAHDVMCLRLKLPGAKALPFHAGQYIEFMLPGGKRRAFSMANPPHEEAFIELHIRHVPNGFFTNQVFNELEPKAILRAEGPFGTFFLREDSDRPIIMMAGGTGFAPIKSMIEHALKKGIERPIHLYRGARAGKDLYLEDLAQGWARAHAHIRYVPVLSEAAEADAWAGRSGWVHEAVAEDFPDLSGHDVYLSGPPPMVEAGRKVFADLGLPAEQLFFDSFEFGADVPPEAG